ncbi:TBC1 domain family [Thecamonas trahens ATCC 50062]|uniref:TBC1 domain family n=1 Tax=Thecamonas trahens ATCC 50062 TaxID=461836 RepID=A0A0L0DB93_THETB|nr:TBC1 domain family [Thecamonas trahens ATCC 50062]KNC49381.1 TBC1 domain family [Thecamonas trahens ATCC 50062]|eukprot:XP_013757806.1 TBC1 domain family [Thecamonas trahens ATCC 50062]
MHAMALAADGSKPLEAVARAREAWRTEVVRGLREMRAKLGLPWARLRSAAELAEDDDDRAVAEDERLVALLDKGLVQPLAINALFRALIRITNPNATAAFTRFFPLGLISLALAVPSRSELRCSWDALSLGNKCCDDSLAPDGPTEWEDAHYEAGKALLATGDVDALRDWARHGIPSSLRFDAWLALLLVAPSHDNALHFDALLGEVEAWDFAIDAPLRADINATANDEHYFVFLDLIRDVALAFVRDRTLPSLLALPGISLVDPSSGAAYPPCGVVPPEGLAHMIAPLAYLSSAPDGVYSVFRALYTRHLVRLSALASGSESLLTLAAAFETWLAELDPVLAAHCTAIGAPPLRAAFPWLVRGFSSFLPPGQLLALWDRIVAYDSLYVVPALAVGIFTLRASSLLECASPQDVAGVLSNLSACFSATTRLDH